MCSIVGKVHALLTLIFAATPVLEKLQKIDVSGSELTIDASGPFTIAAGKYGEHRLYFDLSPMIAVKEALGDIAIKGVERARVTQLDATTVRLVLDFVGAIPKHEVTKDRIKLEAGEAKLKRSTREAAKARPSSVVAIRKVVIDPGHGGKDTGARGKQDLLEKDVNLEIATKLGKELEKLGIKVVYTRTDDRFVSLEQRSSIANRSRADLFISIHANSNKSKRIHGIETYYLNTSSGRYASRLALRENGKGEAPDVDPIDDDANWVSELPLGALGADIRLLLADLAMRSATVESKRVAGYVQSSLIGSLRKDYDGVEDLGVKHALFAVLLGVRMPSILIETGFVTHPKESERLDNAAYQAKVAKAIARGVEKFVDERQQLALR
jgi:N-acetylmuramoyl-L-alanine amidase